MVCVRAPAAAGCTPLAPLRSVPPHYDVSRLRPAAPVRPGPQILAQQAGCSPSARSPPAASIAAADRSTWLGPRPRRGDEDRHDGTGASRYCQRPAAASTASAPSSLAVQFGILDHHPQAGQLLQLSPSTRPTMPLPGFLGSITSWSRAEYSSRGSRGDTSPWSPMLARDRHDGSAPWPGELITDRRAPVDNTTRTTPHPVPTAPSTSRHHRTDRANHGYSRSRAPRQVVSSADVAARVP